MVRIEAASGQPIWNGQARGGARHTTQYCAAIIGRADSVGRRFCACSAGKGRNAGKTNDRRREQKHAELSHNPNPYSP